jgi:hypothetical protein
MDPSADTVRVPLANVNIDAADLSAQTERVDMAQQLIQVGFDPIDTLAKFGLPAISHTGMPSVQLQTPTIAENPDVAKQVYGVEDGDQ